MALAAESHLAQWRSIFSDASDELKNFTPLEQQQWAGRVEALLKTRSELHDASRFRISFLQYSRGYMKEHSWRILMSIICPALALAEMNAPASQSESFIPARSPLDALAAVSRVFGEAINELLIIDPYADQKLITDFLQSSREHVQIKILSDKASLKASLKPASERWIGQYGQVRPLEVRLASERSLHDRIIMVDRRMAWLVGQSFNALADRAPSSLVRADTETASLKMAAYNAIWDTAEHLV